MVEFLIGNIRQLRIIASQDQEFWLAAAMALPNHVGAARSCGDDHRTTPALLQAYGSCAATHNDLCRHCAGLADHAPPLSQFVLEALEAKTRIHYLRSSRVVQFLSRPGNDGQPVIAEHAFRLAQSLSALPTPLLRYWIAYHNEHQSHPTSDDLLLHLCEVVQQYSPEREIAKTADAARNALATGYLRYALRLARKYVNRGLEYEDLVQEGAMGLLTATEKFNYLEHKRFATFATTWMWQYMNRALANDSRLVRLPVHLVDKLAATRKALSAQQALRQQQDAGEASLVALIKDAGYDEQATLHLLGISCVPLRFTDRILPLPRTLVYYLDTSDGTALDDDLEEPLCSSSFNQALGSLSDIQREVLLLRFGFHGAEQTLDEIGQGMHLTRERIRQIEKKALEILRHPANQKRLQQVTRHAPHRSAFQADRRRAKLATALHQALLSGDWADAHPYERTDDFAIEAALNEAFGSRQTNVRQDLTIKGQLITVFGNSTRPVHTSKLLQRLRTANSLEDHQETTLYSVMIGNPDVFLLLGAGVFARSDRKGPPAHNDARVLPYCPSIRAEAIVTVDGLQDILGAYARAPEGITHNRLVAMVITGLTGNTDAPSWYRQNIANLLYVLGLAPYVFLQHDGARQLRKQPIDDPRARTDQCLQSLNDRVEGMPALWTLLERLQPVSTADLARQFAQHHDLAPYDTPNRLSLLLQLGALARSDNGTFCLTDLGWQTSTVCTARQSSDDGLAPLIDVYIDEQETQDEQRLLDDLFAVLTDERGAKSMSDQQ